jgi:antitoxin component YwqK of YwqJK toxin-antitoxin module
MKKITSFVLVLIMLAAMLSACAEKHSHKNDPWTATVEGHYQICKDSKKKINEGKHTLDDENRCTECGATLRATSPSVLEFTAYNKYGLRDYYVEYRMGKEVLRRVYEYVYENGKPVSYTVYDGTEIYEEGIVIKKNGEYERLRTKRNHGDYYSVRTYDEDGLLTSVTDYSKTGKVMNEQKYTYEKDSKGNTISRTNYESDRKVVLEKYALDEKGDLYVCEEIAYNADGTVRYVEKINADGYSGEYTEYENGEIEYVQKTECVVDEKGNILSSKEFINGDLCYERTYKYADYEYAYPKTILGEHKYYSQYGETYIDTYDDCGEVVLSKTVDSDGETLGEVEISYTRDELGRVTLEKEIEDGFVSCETAYEYDGDSDDWSKRTETDNYEDGGKEITVYNSDYEMVSRIEYDADGDIVKNETYEHEYDEYGNEISEKTYSNGVLIGEEKYTFDKDNNKILEETYENGVLVETWEYLPDSRGGTYSAIRTDYYPDGGKRVIHYLENGNISLDIQYNSDGSYFHYFKYTFVTNADGTVTTYTHDKNGKLLYEYRESANGIRIENIAYYSNGNKSVESYDEDGNLERRCEYDKDGNLTSEIIYDEDYNVISETVYHDEGKTVITHNGDGTVTSEVFDKNGNLVSKETI